MSKNKKAREQRRAVNESGDLCRKDGFLSSTAAKPQEHQNLQKEKGGKHRITQTTKMFYQGMRAGYGRGGRGTCAKCQILFFQNHTTTNTHFPLGGCDARVEEVCRKKYLRSSFILTIFSSYL